MEAIIIIHNNSKWNGDEILIAFCLQKKLKLFPNVPLWIEIIYIESDRDVSKLCNYNIMVFQITIIIMPKWKLFMDIIIIIRLFFG